MIGTIAAGDVVSYLFVIGFVAGVGFVILMLMRPLIVFTVVLAVGIGAGILTAYAINAILCWAGVSQNVSEILAIIAGIVTVFPAASCFGEVFPESWYHD